MRKNATRLLLTLLTLFFAFSFATCRKPPSKPDIRVIGVNQLATHDILDAVMAGFMSRMGKEKDIVIDRKNSNGDAMLCRQINDEFVTRKVAVIVALGTLAAQSAVEAAGDKVPVVFGAVTDPVGSKLADSLTTPNGNKTGTTDMWPFDEQLRLVHRLLPASHRIGAVVNPSEDNCNAGMEVYRAVAAEIGLRIEEIPVTSSADVKAAAEVLVAKKVDAILITPSNSVFEAMDALITTAQAASIPIFGGEETAVHKGSIATYGFSNRDVGIATAELTLKVLQLGRNQKAGTIPVSRPAKNRLFINKHAATKAGVTIPADIVAEVGNE